MSWLTWLEAGIDYGRKLVDSGLEGAGRGRDEFLAGEELAPLLDHSAEEALLGAAIGTCVGVVSGYVGSRQGQRKRMIVYGVVGGTLGLAAGLAWGTRGLTKSVAEGMMKKVNQVRDEHWLEKNPIDYA